MGEWVDLEKMNIVRRQTQNKHIYLGKLSILEDPSFNQKDGMGLELGTCLLTTVTRGPTLLTLSIYSIYYFHY